VTDWLDDVRRNARAWGSQSVHGLDVVRVKSRYRCLWCPKGQRKPVTHQARANGVTLAQGCEWHLMRHVRRERVAGRAKR
jgi:hypothetical protein